MSFFSSVLGKLSIKKISFFVVCPNETFFRLSVSLVISTAQFLSSLLKLCVYSVDVVPSELLTEGSFGKDIERTGDLLGSTTPAVKTSSTLLHCTWNSLALLDYFFICNDADIFNNKIRSANSFDAGKTDETSSNPAEALHESKTNVAFSTLDVTHPTEMQSSAQLSADTEDLLFNSDVLRESDLTIDLPPLEDASTGGINEPQIPTFNEFHAMVSEGNGNTNGVGRSTGFGRDDFQHMDVPSRLANTRAVLRDAPMIPGSHLASALSANESESNIQAMTDDEHFNYSETKANLSNGEVDSSGSPESKSIPKDQSGDAFGAQVSSKSAKLNVENANNEAVPDDLLSSDASHFSEVSVTLRRNVAAVGCFAKLLEASKAIKNPEAILNENSDEYMNVPCSADKWFIIEACEPVQLRDIELANYELFSSRVKTFRVSVSDRYPAKSWDVIGVFTARDVKGRQTFNVSSDKLIKYIKFEMLEHYGSEHYCPLSMIRLFGRVSDDLDEEDDDLALHTVGELPTSVPSALSSDVFNDVSISSSSLEPTASIETTENMHLNIIEDVEKESVPHDFISPNTASTSGTQDYSDERLSEVSEPPESHRSQMDSTNTKTNRHANFVLLNRTSQLQNKVMDTSSVNAIRDALPEVSVEMSCNTEFSADSGVQCPHSEIPGSLQPDAHGSRSEKHTTTAVQPANSQKSALPPTAMPASSDVHQVLKHKVEVVPKRPTYGIFHRLKGVFLSALDSIFHSVVSPVTGGLVEEEYSRTSTDSVSVKHRVYGIPQKDGHLAVTSCEEAIKLLNLSFAGVHKYDRSSWRSGYNILQLFVAHQYFSLFGKTSVEEFFVRIWCEGGLWTFPDIMGLQTMMPCVQLMCPKLPSFLLNLVSETEVVKPVISYEPILRSGVPSYSTLNKHNSGYSKVETAKTRAEIVVPAALVGSRKDTTLMRLSNRVRLLERNVSVSMRYLEELSQSYRRQMDRLSRSFNLTTAWLKATAQGAEERDHMQQVRVFLSALDSIFHSVVSPVTDFERREYNLSTVPLCSQHLLVIHSLFVYGLLNHSKTNELPIQLPESKKRGIDLLLCCLQHLGGLVEEEYSRTSTDSVSVKHRVLRIPQKDGHLAVTSCEEAIKLLNLSFAGVHKYDRSSWRSGYNILQLYLEELSQSYRRQMDRLSRSFNLTTAWLKATAQGAEERDHMQQARIDELEIRLDELLTRLIPDALRSASNDSIHSENNLSYLTSKQNLTVPVVMSVPPLLSFDAPPDWTHSTATWPPLEDDWTEEDGTVETEDEHPIDSRTYRDQKIRAEERNGDVVMSGTVFGHPDCTSAEYSSESDILKQMLENWLSFFSSNLFRFSEKWTFQLFQDDSHVLWVFSMTVIHLVFAVTSQLIVYITWLRPYCQKLRNSSSSLASIGKHGVGCVGLTHPMSYIPDCCSMNAYYRQPKAPIDVRTDLIPCKGANHSSFANGSKDQSVSPHVEYIAQFATIKEQSPTVDLTESTENINHQPPLFDRQMYAHVGQSLDTGCQPLGAVTTCNSSSRLSSSVSSTSAPTCPFCPSSSHAKFKRRVALSDLPHTALKTDSSNSWTSYPQPLVDSFCEKTILDKTYSHSVLSKNARRRRNRRERVKLHKIQNSSGDASSNSSCMSSVQG
ncbi:hypothetical protein AHF37_00327 [Paragonimus kellicotti]|nr:hypothetical protein AHF37_00327 [Paragonimus kellicotti]